MSKGSARTKILCGEFLLIAVMVVLAATALALWFFRAYGEHVMMSAVGFTIAVTTLSALPYLAYLAFRVSSLYADNDGLMRAALTDRLTGVLNRQGFDQQFRAHLRALVGQPERGLMLLIVDADHFKRINDQLGHPVGDIALKKIATTLKRLTRETDAVGRLGGEEFVIALPCGSSEQGEIVAERLRAAINRLYVGSGTKGAQLSVSIGGVFMRTPHSFAQVYEAADANLYRAKDGGRNRCTITKIAAGGRGRLRGLDGDLMLDATR
ncbi:GGDEF domain-containing protein [Jiella sp. MQZ9-1]|uniref:diguanylate cyclase n=1 Tax=Jiella flava TaxID=2816857 RepID=A0A939FWH6_9HYPH|nr:GGDEF domain-containing protein [Jiella flava]MBO0661526.1 GGDEF domain-containing protein [Jiella flava]MCD2470168.1 GGDEF domain-containing protein [Jiella flava]